MASISRAVVTVVLVASILSVSVKPLSAQLMDTHLRSSPTLGVGYVVNVPNTYVGFSLLGIVPQLLGGLGLYADFKFSHNSPEREPEFLEGITWQEAEYTYGDQFFEERSAYVTFDLALAYAVRDELAVYLGAGYSRERHYFNYFDDELNRGIEGFYWAFDEGESGTRVNILGGLLIRAAPHFVIQVGIDGRPRGGTVGAMFTLPL